MAESHQKRNPSVFLITTIFVFAVIIIIAALTDRWALSALPIGFLFGFFLQKGQLCGASAMSEIVMLRDTRKMVALWIAIITSMILFAAASHMNLIKLNPKPLLWANVIIGGIIFGAGTVLAGGCVSGALFKAGAGNLNSIVALPGIALGVAAVAYGPLAGFQSYLKKNFVLKSAGGQPITLPSLTSLHFTIVTLILLAVTLLIIIISQHKRIRGPLCEHSEDNKKRIKSGFIYRPWKAWQTGLAIGILGLAAYISSAESGRNYPLGVTGGVLHTHTLATSTDYKSVWSSNPSPSSEIPQTEIANKTAAPKRKVVWWLVFLVAALIFGSHVAARLSGAGKLLPKPPGQVVVAFLGGLLVGIGAGIGGGCVIGNIISGTALLSMASIIFAMVTILSNWAVTYLYLIGKENL